MYLLWKTQFLQRGSPANPAENLLQALCDRQWSKSVCGYSSSVSPYVMHCFSSLYIFICICIYAFSSSLSCYGVLSSSVTLPPAKLSKKHTSLHGGKMKQEEAVSNKAQWHKDTDYECQAPENGVFCAQKHCISWPLGKMPNLQSCRMVDLRHPGERSKT